MSLLTSRIKNLESQIQGTSNEAHEQTQRANQLEIKLKRLRGIQEEKDEEYENRLKEQSLIIQRIEKEVRISHSLP